MYILGPVYMYIYIGYMYIPLIVIYITDDELAEDGDEPIMPGGKVGTKKLRKLQAKADKKAMREVVRVEGREI